LIETFFTYWPLSSKNDVPRQHGGEDTGDKTFRKDSPTTSPFSNLHLSLTASLKVTKTLAATII